MLPFVITEIPGPNSRSILQNLHQVECSNTTFLSDRFPVCCEKAAAANVWDCDGNRFLDVTSFFGVASIGHSNPQVVKAIQAQCTQMIHAMGDVHPSVLKIPLLNKLQSIAPSGLEKTILSSSGSEAIETAMKTMMLSSKSPYLLSFTSGYHGLGLGSLHVTAWDFFQSPFKEWIKQGNFTFPYPNCYRCPFGKNKSTCGLFCLSELESFLKENHVSPERIGGIIIEPIQGRGGVIVPPEGFLRGLRCLCDELGIFLCFDEIFTGLGRTGYRWACDFDPVVPDIMCIGKALGGGVPISACIGTAIIMDSWGESTGEALHTSTFLGNPLTMAASLASIQEIEKFLPQIPPIACHLQKRLLDLKEEVSWIGDVRGRGLMWGIECVYPVDNSSEIPACGRENPFLAKFIMVELLRRGIFILTSGEKGNILSITPPFVITPDEIDFVIKTLQEVGENWVL